MRADVQSEVGALFPQVTTENLREVTDFAGFQREFRNLIRLRGSGRWTTSRPFETDVSLGETPG